MKKSALLFFVSALLISFVACKPKQSAYKAAYEKATEKEAVEEVVEEAPVKRQAPPTRPPQSTASNASTTREKVSAIDGQIKRFSVVIGSFSVKANADRLKSEMSAKGFTSFLALNEKNMYRVIVATYDEKSDAAYKRDEIKSDYAPKFNDAWILEREF